MWKIDFAADLCKEIKNLWIPQKNQREREREKEKKNKKEKEKKLS